MKRSIIATAIATLLLSTSAFANGSATASSGALVGSVTVTQSDNGGFSAAGTQTGAANTSTAGVQSNKGQVTTNASSVGYTNGSSASVRYGDAYSNTGGIAGQGGFAGANGSAGVNHH